MDGGYEPFVGDQAKFAEMEASMEKQRSKGRGDVKAKGISARLSAIHEDQEAWETNRLVTAGAARQKRVALEFDEELDSRVQLMVHNTKPPFLDGTVNFSTVKHIVSTVVDPTCDMAVCARKGSAVLQRVREAQGAGSSAGPADVRTATVGGAAHSQSCEEAQQHPRGASEVDGFGCLELCLGHHWLRPQDDAVVVARALPDVLHAT